MNKHLTTAQISEAEAHQAAISDARSAIAAIVAKRDAFLPRIAAATAAVNEALATRAELVQSVTDGKSIPANAASKAEQATRDATAVVVLLQDAHAGHARAIQGAEADLALSVRAEADRRWRAAVASRIAIAERIDAACAALGAANSDWLSNSAEMESAWRFGRSPESHEIEALRDFRAVAWAIPAELQSHIVRTGSTKYVPLAPKTRATWQDRR